MSDFAKNIYDAQVAEIKKEQSEETYQNHVDNQEIQELLDHVRAEIQSNKSKKLVGFQLKTSTNIYHMDVCRAVLQTIVNEFDFPIYAFHYEYKWGDEQYIVREVPKNFTTYPTFTSKGITWPLYKFAIDFRGILTGKNQVEMSFVDALYE